jgi:K+/H+ antiporter YhaU regulatory subunit KhtT
MAGTGAMIGSMFAPGIGTAIGAGVGALAGLFMGSLEQQEKEAQRKREEAEQREADRQAALLELEAARKTEYEKMEEHLRKLAEKQADVYLDSNQVNIGLRMGEYKMG